MGTDDSLFTEEDKEDVDIGIAFAIDALEGMVIGDMESIDKSIQAMVKRCENNTQKYAALHAMVGFLTQKNVFYKEKNED